ncbi:MAG: hypothetical protein HWN67_06065 [Candidatus Helarchaeota archaeon]|nr:hypothetical protein [Candidatus Helarchaeota archaeon]
MDMRIERVLSKDLNFSYITAKFSRIPNAKTKIYSIVGLITSTTNRGFDVAPNNRNIYLLRDFVEYLKKENKIGELKKLIFGDPTKKIPPLLAKKGKIGAHTNFWVIEEISM